jgi:hypothetical protein
MREQRWGFAVRQISRLGRVPLGTRIAGWRMNLEDAMAKTERLRDVLSGPPTPEYLREKAAAGWTMAAILWEREVSGDAASAPVEPVPYGLKIADDCSRLEEDLQERRALILMLELIVQDRPLSFVADELNKQGFRTRHGTAWTPGSVFDMLPRLIEVGPRVFTSEEWIVKRGRLMNVV